eukprot:TRINITY_DN9233_c0_g1_i9.p1 TRINITY_DN9233_c0_g1~~TRINITY_DN9233_c0_g1_i9.p1  ORF type:complete len:1235 (-),score=335.81 TRINITY_DN9233_c0_g1_i9:171-3875(-)
MLRSLVGSEMCIRDRYQRRVRGRSKLSWSGVADRDCWWPSGTVSDPTWYREASLMDPALLDRLQDKQPEGRVAALEKLRASVRDNNGHFLVGNLKKAFQSIEPLISDSNTRVRQQCTSLLCDIIPELAKGDELEVYMPSVLPLVVKNMRSVDVRDVSESTLKMFVKHTGNLGAVALLLQEHGTRSDNSEMRCAAVKFMPLLVQQVDKGGVDSRLLVLALVERLEDPDPAVVTATIKALLGIRGMLGETARKYIDSLKLNERKPLPSVPQCMTVQHDLVRVGMNDPALPSAPVPSSTHSLRREDPPAKRSEQFGFGIIPQELVQSLHIQDWKVRAPAVQQLLDLFSSKEDISGILPYLKELVQLLLGLLDDPNFKISLTSISIIGALVARLGRSMSKQSLEELVPAIAEKLSDKKIVIRQESMKVMVKLMAELKPKRMTEMSIQIAAHKNSYVREELIHLFMLAVIEYGPAALDMQAIVRVFRDGLFDVKDRVRFIAMEAFTLLRSKIGQSAVEQFLAGIGPDVVRPLHARFQDSRVPTISESGLIESCFTLSRQGSDGSDLGEPPSPIHSALSSPAGGQPRNSSSALINQRPRHQSAGTAQHRQIPWKVPNLRSRAGPSGSGRRHRSAAAAIVPETNPAGPRRDGIPDEPMSVLSPSSCPPEFGDNPFGDETAPPHMSAAWRHNENTDLQVEEAMSGLYSSWGAPSILTNKTGSELLLGSESSSWQSLSPSTPSSSIFPGNNHRGMDHQLSSPSPAPSTSLPDVEEDSEYASSAQSKEKISLWLPSGVKQNDPRLLKKAMLWDDFGPTQEEHSDKRSDNLRILKSKHKPTAPRRNGSGAMPSSEINPSSGGLSSLNIGEAALPDMPESFMPPQRKLTARVPRKLLKKDGQTPRGAPPLSHESTPRGEHAGAGHHRGSEVMGMGIEGMSVHAHEPNEPPASTAMELTSMESRDLTPVGNPSKTLESCMGAIILDKWDTQLDALTKLRRLAVHHPEVLRHSLGQVSKDVLNSCNSLRSNLAKNALRCVCDFFEGLGRSMDPMIESTVKIMMNKMTEASGFINGEAERVLQTMVTNATDTKVLASLMSMSDHRHPIIRAKSAMFVDRCVEQIGPNLTSTGMLDKLLQVLMQYSSDSSQEARAYGKQAIGKIARIIPTEFERATRRALSASQQQKLEQIISSDSGKFCSPLPPGRPRGGFRGDKRGARGHSDAAGRDGDQFGGLSICLLYTSPSPRDS